MREEDLMAEILPPRVSTGQAARGWMATVAATTGLVFGPSTILLFLFGSLVAPLEQAFGWSRPSILFAATIVSLMIMIISPFQGILIDRFGARLLVLVSTVTFASGLAAMALMRGDIRVYYLMYALLAVLAIGLWPVSYLRIVSTWFDRRLGLGIGIANGGIGIGATLLPLLVVYLLGRGDLGTVYLGLAAIVLVVTLPLNFLFLHEGPHSDRPRSRSIVVDIAELRPFLREGNFVLLTIAFFLLGFVNTGLVTNQIPLLIDGGLTPTQAAAVQAAFGLSVLFGRFLTGLLLDYIEAKTLMSVVCVGGAIACGLYAVGTTGAVVFVCAILIGAIYGAEFDVLSYLVRRLFGLSVFGRIYGLIFAVFQLGAALGATLLPLSKVYLGGYAPGLFLYALALIACAGLFSRLGSPTPRTHRV
jgi:MFS family permease